MSDVVSLQHKVDKLQIDNEHHIHDVGDLPDLDTDSKLASTPAAYPPLPKAVKTSDRYYVLAWKLDEEWLEKIGRKYGDPSMGRRLGFDIVGLFQLREKSNYHDLNFHSVIPEGVVVEDYDDEDLPVDSVIAVAYTASTYLYYNRPTRAQYAWLCKVFSSEPRWYRDEMLKEEFYQHGISLFGP